MPWSGPVLTTVHDLSVLRFPHWHPPDRVRWYEADFEAGLRITTHFIAVSRFTQREMTAMLGIPPERISVIPLGPRRGFQPQPAGEVRRWLSGHGLPGRYLLYVGTVEPRKNLPGLLGAYGRLPRPLRQQFPLLAAGVAGWGIRSLEPLVHGLGLEGQVWPLGYVPEEDLPWLYAGAAALVWPSFYEGFGLPPLEAAACGTPVITSLAGAMPEVMGDAAVLVDPLDEEALSRAIRRVLEDAEEAARLRECGLARSRQFSWEICAARHAELYRRLAG